ncbi:hypothetical protein EHF32_01185 [Microbacterium sp. RG1]|nr:hypothetical protein EHF32_01185 [Microbacterium sp. RG1]
MARASGAFAFPDHPEGVAMSANVGYATLNIIPAAKDFGKNLSSQVSPAMNSAGRSGGNALYSGLTDGLARSVTAALGAASTIGAALVGMAAAGGFSRALKLDEARTKLTALNYTTEQSKAITESALASVKGTAYGLDSAVNSAVGLLAAGIQPGQQLTGVLTTIGNTAALAGVSMDEMGSIFNKVAANGKVTTEEMNQLADRGVPIWVYLGESIGVNNTELRKMIETGQVTAEMFYNALGPAVEGVAGVMGGSFMGSLGNVQAALSRLGALFIQPALPVLTSALGAATGVLDGFGTVLTPLVERWAAFLSADAGTLTGTLGAMLPVLGLLGGLLGPLLTQIPILGAAFAGLTGPVGLAAGALIAMFAVAPAQLATGVDTITGLIGEMLNSLVAVAASALPMMAQRLAENLPILVGGFRDVLTTLASAIPLLLPPIVGAVVTVIPGIATALIGAVGTIIDAGTQLLMGLARAVPVMLPALLDAVVGMLPSLVGSIMSMLPQVLDTAVELFTALADSIPKVLPGLLQTIVGILPSILSSVISMLPKLLQGAIDLFLALVQAVPKIIPPLIKSIVDLLPTLLSSVISMLPALINGAVELFLGIVKALPQIIPALINSLISLAPIMVETLISLVPTLITAGVNLIGGLVKGLWDAAGKVGSALLDIAKGAIKDFLSFLGIHSPSRLFQGYGVNLGQGLAIGISSMEGDVSKATMGLATAAEDAVSGVSLMMDSGRGVATAIDTGDGGALGRHLATVGTGKSVTLNYTNNSSMGLTAEQELVVAARHLQHAA